MIFGEEETVAVFSNNLTSSLLLKSCIESLDGEPKRILEIGCGSGFISRELILSGKCFGNEHYLSDISAEAVDFAKEALKDSVPSKNFRVGSCLRPWKFERFDLIVSDVAGISNSIAKISSWYQGVEYEAGEDGLVNTLDVLSAAKDCLKPSGTLVFPILSLSNRKRLRFELNKFFPTWKETKETKWPLPLEIAGELELLSNLSSKGLIEVDYKYGKVLAGTSVAVCSI
jgi:SAM-dependent methyltransferase